MGMRSLGLNPGPGNMEAFSRQELDGGSHV